MAKYGFKLNKKGVGELLKSQDIAREIKTYADGVQNAAGEEYEVAEFVTRQRVGYRVNAGTPHAYYSNLKHNTLEKALGTVRK